MALASIASSDKYPTFREKRDLSKTVRDHAFKQVKKQSPRKQSPQDVYSSKPSPDNGNKRSSRKKRDLTRNIFGSYQSGDPPQIDKTIPVPKFGQTKSQGFERLPNKLTKKKVSPRNYKNSSLPNNKSIYQMKRQEPQRTNQSYNSSAERPTEVEETHTLNLGQI